MTTSDLITRAPDSGLIERSAVIDLLARLANDHADMALTGEPDNARAREAMEAAFTRVKYAVAFLPAVELGKAAALPAPSEEEIASVLVDALKANCTTTDGRCYAHADNDAAEVDGEFSPRALARAILSASKPAPVGEGWRVLGPRSVSAIEGLMEEYGTPNVRLRPDGIVEVRSWPEALASPALQPDGGGRAVTDLTRDFARMVGRLDHTGDDGFTWPDEPNDAQWALDAVIAKARDLMAMMPGNLPQPPDTSTATSQPGGDGWRDIESAPRDDDTYIMASVTGKVWFQCCWDPEDECWCTFNLYVEQDIHKREGAYRPFDPKFWTPLPQPPAAQGGE